MKNLLQRNALVDRIYFCNLDTKDKDFITKNDTNEVFDFEMDVLYDFCKYLHWNEIYWYNHRRSVILEQNFCSIKIIIRVLKTQNNQQLLKLY